MTKYTIDLILYKYQPNARGLFPIYLRATIKRKPAYKSTGHFVSKKLWDEKNQRVRGEHTNAELINAHLLFTKQEWEKKLITEQLKGTDLSASQLKKSLVSDQHNIFRYVENLIMRLKGKRSSATLKNYEKHLRKLEEYNGSGVLLFENIDVAFLSNYEAWLRENIAFRKPDEQKNYIHAIWKTFKKFFNEAKKEKLITHYPFEEYENPIYVSPDKDHLTESELKLFEKFTDSTKDNVLKECAVYFLLGCYSGLRISDWYQFNYDKHVKGNKIRLRPRKGASLKNKWVEMIISKPLKRNLERMKQTPLTLKEPTINEKLKIIAGKAGINKYLTSHSGRHTFAVTICLGNKISSETGAELMGITLDTFVKNYSNVTQQKIDTETAIAWKRLQ